MLVFYDTPMFEVTSKRIWSGIFNQEPGVNIDRGSQDPDEVRSMQEWLSKRKLRRVVEVSRIHSVQLVTAIAIVFATLGCSKDSTRPPPYEAPNGDGGSGSTSQISDRCAGSTNEGCPCTDAGETVECGRVTNKSGDYVTCSIGYATCDGSKWGACIGNRVVTQSVPKTKLSTYGKRTMGISSNCNNPCDPYCTNLDGESTDVDGGGISVTDAGISITETVGTGGPGSGPCRGLWCQVSACNGLPKTSISGKVYDPAGKNPLYNAYVYIPVDPTAALPVFPEGASCDTCAGAASVSAIAVAQTGPDGSFVLNNVPSGASVPLVVQMGKWRRKVTLPSLAACQDNPIESTYSRLPRNRFDGDGNVADIPRMAIASGSADPFECLLLKAGIDPAEIQLPGKGSRIEYYRYNGKDRSPGGAPTGVTLTGNVSTLKKYDVVLLPCEGAENIHNTQAPNIVEYTKAGGRVFTTHYGYVWLATPAPAGVASNKTEFYATAKWDIGRNDYTDPMIASIDQSFPKGIAFAQWLQNVSASTTLGKMSVVEPRHNAINAVAGKSQRWVYGSSKVATVGTPDMLLAMTFNTPVNAVAEQQCGRVVFSDFHVSADALVSTSGCGSDTDCGFGATCNPGVVGTCAVNSCTTNWDCDSGFTCVGAAVGACSTQACSKKKDCGGRSCNWGKCATGSCYSDDDCGASGTCSGGKYGVCSRTCTTNANCASGYTCVSGQCTKSCYSDTQCSSGTCNNGVAPACSATDTMFPLTCRNGDLTGQEKALEFMLFDLSACVSPDSWSPPTPSTQYNPVSFSLDFTAECAQGTLPVWREFLWRASIPNTSNITYTVSTAGDASGLVGATAIPLAIAKADTLSTNWDTAFIDTTTGAFHSVSPAIASLKMLRVGVTLNPTTDLKATPTLSSWRATYDCMENL